MPVSRAESLPQKRAKGLGVQIGRRSTLCSQMLSPSLSLTHTRYSSLTLTLTLVFSDSITTMGRMAMEQQGARVGQNSIV